MQVSISVRHGHLGEASQEKLKAKADKLARIFERIMAVEITVDLKDEQTPRVDIHVSAEHKHDFVSHATSETLLGAFDGAIQKIEQQLRKYKERVQERHRNSNSRHHDLDNLLVNEVLSEERVADELVEE